MKLIYKYLLCILTFHITFTKNIRQSGYWRLRVLCYLTGYLRSVPILHQERRVVCREVHGKRERSAERRKLRRGR